MWTLARRIACLVCALAVAACSGGAGAPDFTLRDDSGNSWSLSQQRGKAVLLTFGFTHCADTCPATLAKLMRISGALPSGERDVEVAFVTIDPARDTVPVLHRYIARFDSPGDGRLVGLTGTAREIERVKTAYGIWSRPSTTLRMTGKYDIAHTAAIVLIDPRGQVRGVRYDDDSEASLARAIEEMLPS